MKSLLQSEVIASTPKQQAHVVEPTQSLIVTGRTQSLSDRNRTSAVSKKKSTVKLNTDELTPTSPETKRSGAKKVKKEPTVTKIPMLKSMMPKLKSSMRRSTMSKHRTEKALDDNQEMKNNMDEARTVGYDERLPGDAASAINLVDRFNRIIYKKPLHACVAVLGFVNSFNCVFHFSSAAHTHGLVPFILAYFISILLFGLPVLYLEMLLGQYHRLSPIVLFRRISPGLQGVGWMMMILSMMSSIFHCVLSVHSMKYFMTMLHYPKRSFLGCMQEWNTRENCIVLETNPCMEAGQAYVNGQCVNMNVRVDQLATRQFHMNFIFSPPISFTDYQAVLASMPNLMLLIVFWSVVIHILNAKGISPVSVYVYVVNIAAFFIGTTVSVVMYKENRKTLTNDDVLSIANVFTVADLANIELWTDAILTVSMTLSLGRGGIITIAGFCGPTQNAFLISVSMIIVNLLLCFISTWSIFASIAHIMRFIGLKDVIGMFYAKKVGYIDIFLVYPLANTFIRGSVWVMMFFFIFFCIGVQYAFLVSLTASITIMDAYAIDLTSRKSTKVYLSICCILALFSTFFIIFDQNYMYILELNNVVNYISIMVILVEVLIVTQLYGTRTMYNDMAKMMGVPLDYFNRNIGYYSVWWKICWNYTLPVILPSVLLLHFYGSNPLTASYHQQNHLTRVITSTDLHNSLIQTMQIQLCSVLMTAVMATVLLVTWRQFRKHFAHVEFKKFYTKVLFMNQRHLRAYKRIVHSTTLEKAKMNEIMLPLMEPGDIDGNLAYIYKEHLQKRRRQSNARLVKPIELELNPNFAVSVSPGIEVTEKSSNHRNMNFMDRFNDLTNNLFLADGSVDY